MGTRCITLIYDHGIPIMNIFRQFDGYPFCHGKEIAEFIKDRKIITGGISENQAKTTDRHSHTMGCFAASLIGHLKGKQLGNIYIYPVTMLECWHDYEYHIHENKVIVMNYNGNVMFDGNWKDFEEFCEEDE